MTQTVRWCWLVFIAVWLLAVMPGHKRGVVRTPGSDADNPAACATDCCGNTRPTTSDPDAEPADSERFPGDPARDCALCFLRGTMDLPVAVEPPAVRLLFAYDLPAPPGETRPATHTPRRTATPRAPPTA